MLSKYVLTEQAEEFRCLAGTFHDLIDLTPRPREGLRGEGAAGDDPRGPRAGGQGSGVALRGLALLLAQAAAQAASAPAAADLRPHLQPDGAQRRRQERRSLRGRQRAWAAGRGSPYLLVDEAVEDADQEALPDRRGELNRK